MPNPPPATQPNPRHKRIRRVKKWLRPLPRRATLHRYPILKWFAVAARKRSYLWSFRPKEVIPAIYAGSILTMMPLFGIQLALSLFASIIFRCNLVVTVALQGISNPFTLAFIYPAAYFTGDFVLNLFDFDFGAIAEDHAEAYEEIGMTHSEHTISILHYVLRTMLGGAILGYILAVILSVIYKYSLYLSKKNNHPFAR